VSHIVINNYASRQPLQRPCQAISALKDDVHGYAPWVPNAEIHGNQRNSDDRELIEAVVVANRVLQALFAGDTPITLWDLARKLKLTLPRVYR
jgi:hypothetical protein